MTAQLDVDRLVRVWLRDGPTELPGDVLRDVLGQAASIPQRPRRWWGSLRLPAGNAFRLASASAVALVTLVILVLGGSGLPSVGPGPSASPSVSPTGWPSGGPSTSSTSSPSVVPTPSDTPAPSETSGPEPTATMPPKPTGAASGRVVLEIGDVTHTTSVIVGEPIVFEAIVRNRGDLAGAPIEVQFSRLSDNAAFLRCTPACTTSMVYGTIHVAFNSGIGAGQTMTARVEFRTTAPGDVFWDANIASSDGLGFLAICQTFISPGRTLTPTIAPPPVNDNPPGVAVTALPFTDTTNVTLAQVQALEPSTTCGSGSKSVWYSYTASAGGTVEAATLGSDYDTVLDVWRGSLSGDVQNPGFGTLEPVACNDDAGGPQSAVVFATQAGQSYVIRVTSKDGGGGNLVFRVVAR